MPEALKRTPVEPSVVRASGALARAALQRSGGFMRPVPGFESTPFRFAAGELIWIAREGPQHPRSVLVTGDISVTLRLCEGGLVFSLPPSSKTVGAQDLRSSTGLRTASRAILDEVTISNPTGFGALLAGRMPAFPLSHRVAAAHALAQACSANDVEAFKLAARQLIGAGAGLTPSGDDFVGGALFALHYLQDSQEWRDLAADTVATASQRSHTISATLLSDLAQGQSYAALHDFLEATASGDPLAATRSVSALVSIGSSSGWDMLAGVSAALFGSLEFQ